MLALCFWFRTSLDCRLNRDSIKELSFEFEELAISSPSLYGQKLEIGFDAEWLERCGWRTTPLVHVLECSMQNRRNLNKPG